ncbi:protein-L-isoaspartate O-methyltransferase family protein [Pelomonas aquatica]|jgi:protein-L-isoaspartate(D-aspartate) O-methyltransferase|uniref:Protein-L-isoaspartate O-methyltransferase n=1 Tax=Pelomonas aquatica TaxID=431058 RepID=A0A9X4LE63_9BURK|nr:protein-L-isoaspartate O-methyltransferase [Pelomonas aquatica]MCY4753787.1 protein-L-isoaspartate O-methyltransferase [Pelomonas aquatica]MDG0861114.1 protein-L-isoaspartate O-methyltransferase [Pelomonas aquatica]
MNLEQARFNMIEQQIRPWDVLDPGVLELLHFVHREDFVPEAHRAQAFVDTELPLSATRRMLAPKVEARLLQELKLQRHEKVLEIGAATGHLAALLGRQAQRVIALEADAGLATQAAANLRRAGALNVTVLNQDGAAGLAAEEPFDAILLSGSVAELPQALLNQLKVGGRLIAIVGTGPVMRAVLVTRTGAGEFRRVELFDTVAGRLPGFAEAPAFSF